MQSWINRRTVQTDKRAVVFAIASGLGVSVVGYYSPFMIAGSMIMAVGAGLFILFKVVTPMSMWYVIAD